ncbi:hypothetical protein [Photobacterium galatheae]|uniref:SWIM-type domain-containing protein n=1 Tax=Photobacterium galatheae TaxID=1654360 RepID=A0A066RYQ4_9GAMM|nr:hypothetical protein [Photobacterium galatheae]KDM92812.1 hypothetical protein EA58_05420 [Photobacterium galatheae]MCM0149270.1 hypothetical protein [Photobacterium galatheae]
MEVTYRYARQSQVGSDRQRSEMAFAPDLSRPPTFFVGELKDKRRFREGMSCLHQVVMSDMRFQPKNRDDYQRWLADEEVRLLAEFSEVAKANRQELEAVQADLARMNAVASEIMAPYYKAQAKYFNYLYQQDIDAWYVLDPVITVHPDQVFFECFSEDESSYGKLSCRYDVFEHVSEQAFGTTNIDYSLGLYQEFQKIRDYRATFLKIDPEGFNIQTSGSSGFEEKKIDLPESWVRGFLQVSSAMTLPMVKLRLQPMDIHNLCLHLKRKKEQTGPRAMKFELLPGQPIRVVMEPWNEVIRFDRSIYQGDTPRTIRVWGRRRLLILERLLPVADAFDVFLLEDGFPSFYIAHMGAMSFTLGLSGWSANDWSRAGNFDLLAPRDAVEQTTSQKVYDALAASHLESAASLAARLNLDLSVVKSALAQYSQLGLVLYDLEMDVYRLRHLYNAPVDLDEIRFSHDRERKASHFVQANLVTVEMMARGDLGAEVSGCVLDNGREHQVALTIDRDQRLINAQCECHFWHQHKLRQGPCEHMLALRLKSAGGSL